jgi:hypothetical protein
MAFVVQALAAFRTRERGFRFPEGRKEGVPSPPGTHVHSTASSSFSVQVTVIEDGIEVRLEPDGVSTWPTVPSPLVSASSLVEGP